MNEAQRQVLRMLESGAISAGEANRLLAALGNGTSEAVRPEEMTPVVEAAPEEPTSVEPTEDEAPVFKPEPPAAPVDVSALAAASSGEVLRQLAQGQISADEANMRLDDAAVVTDADASDADSGDVYADPAPAFDAPEDPVPVRGVLDSLPPDMDRLRRAWQSPFFVALGIAVLGALVMSATYGSGSILGGLAFLVGWLVFILALVGAGIAYWSRTARWVHVRVEEHGGQRFQISLPVPVRFMDSLLHLARPFLKGDALRHMETAATFLASMDEELRQPGGSPLVVDVDDGGDRVQIYFG